MSFERVRPAYLDDDEYTDLQRCLVNDPRLGPVVPRSGGVRKLRWRRPGAGKRGGLRVVYFVRDEPREIWMLTLYAKSENDNIPGHIHSAGFARSPTPGIVARHDDSAE